MCFALARSVAEKHHVGSAEVVRAPAPRHRIVIAGAAIDRRRPPMREQDRPARVELSSTSDLAAQARSRPAASDRIANCR
jgi:hypothetical protein